MKDVLCIYHGNCADGFTAAWVVHRALSKAEDVKNLAFFAGVYGQEPPNCEGKDVIIVDFSYKQDVMIELRNQCNSMVVLDHHETAERELEGFFDNSKVEGVFDMNHSGAMLAWLHFFPEEQPPRLVNHVEDRDLWRFNFHTTRDINAVIFSYDYTFENWDKLHDEMEQNTPFMALVEQGKAIERKHHKDVGELVKTFKRELIIAGHRVPVANVPYTMVSDAAHMMAKGQPFAACYWDTPVGRVFGLRSTEDGLNVAEIAEQYNGGGHAHAAGFTVSYDKISEMEIPAES